ncbi:carbonic anhydrase family protein [Saccharothrix deserti]|uniref:carbonic anhydrase family protein n=1 Tax=Saccharothrix deserti TaxID=2593674 RepID=UPI00131BAA05|nr:carbonic anhydrase family protein [Saccharothrix deserti]
MRLKQTLPVLVTLVLAGIVTTGTFAQSQTSSQSPVNVTLGAIRSDPSQPELDATYGHSELELKYISKDAASTNGCTVRNREETEEAEVTPGSGYVTVAGVRYDLVQFHFHTPSEHRFAGYAFPLEMHLVHRSAAGKLLVIGVPIQAGPKSVVDDVLAALAPECGDPVDVPAIDLNQLLPSTHYTFHYNGSLTTAPYTEGVSWYLATPLTVTSATLARFKAEFPEGNARQVQPLNGRTFAGVPII